MAAQQRVVRAVLGQAASYMRWINGEAMEPEHVPTWADLHRSGQATADDADLHVAEWRADPKGALNTYLGITGQELLVLLHRRERWPEVAAAIRAGQSTRDVLDAIADGPR